MLVEDDKSLREIYGVRLLAEGYDIVSAGDGEEALAMAIKERPQLILSDVMMPKVSGFDMLDILRSTTETKDIKVIMMTALSSEEQRIRGESLGADRYLVKSQVGIEDVVHVVHEILRDTPSAVGQPPQQPPKTTSAMPVPPARVATPVASPVVGVQPLATMPSVQADNTQPAPVAVPTPNPVRPPLPEPPKPASLKTRVIQPLNDPNISPVNINELLDKEWAKEAGITDDARPVIATTDQEKAIIDQQLQTFAPPEPPSPVMPETPQVGPILPNPDSTMPTPGVAPTPDQTTPPNA